jgi:hypothetical protein
VLSNRLIHNMDTAWVSSAPATLQASVDNLTLVEGTASTRVTSQGGTLNAFIQFAPAAPLDLRAFEELRFWVRSNRAAHGSTNEPFYLEFSYVDNGDAAGETHRWLVPINQSERWEQRRIGIENERRAAIISFRLTCLSDVAFVCHLDDLLAVHEEMMADLEQALVSRLDNQVSLPGVTNILLDQPAAINDTQIVLPLSRGFATNNRIIVRGGAAGDEVHIVTGVAHNMVAGTTTLSFGVGDEVRGALNAGVASASILVPAAVSPPSPAPDTTPAILMTLTEAREDYERTGFGIQRDSFRSRGTLTVCSVRPCARAYGLTYSVRAIAPQRTQILAVQSLLFQQLSSDIPLRINGYPSPVWILPPPAGTVASAETPIPLLVRIGTRMEVSARQERPWVQRADVQAGRIDAPLDQEGIVIQL